MTKKFIENLIFKTSFVWMSFLTILNIHTILTSVATNHPIFAVAGAFLLSTTFWCQGRDVRIARELTNA